MSYTIDPSKVDPNLPRPKNMRAEMMARGARFDEPDRVPGTTKLRTYCGNHSLYSRHSSIENAEKRAAKWKKNSEKK